VDEKTLTGTGFIRKGRKVFFGEMMLVDSILYKMECNINSKILSNYWGFFVITFFMTK
jgi:hypothetical protein